MNAFLQPRLWAAVSLFVGVPVTVGSTNSLTTARDHWSLRPIIRPTLPKVRNMRWPLNPIDYFILAKLEQKGLAPAPEAGQATLLRRVSFDLLGLPPTLRELDAFSQAKLPTAYETSVDRLLASPQYGERWGRHWLDVVRYTESQGFEYDHMRENAWHYRDYVIKSFNEDKPYDRFIREQIAGDALESATSEGLIATSLLVCGAWDQAGNSQANAAQRMATREEEMEDLISVVGQTFLGLTLNCARCHSHKFDPIPQEDYYRVKAVFDGVQHGERVIAAPSEVRAHDERVANLKRKIAALESSIAAVEGAGRARATAKRREADSSARTSELQRSIPPPISHWQFETDDRDELGGLHGKLQGGAKIANGTLQLNGMDAFVETAPLSKNIRAKTLLAWIAVEDLDQTGGGVITIEAPGGTPFDAIVFGERQARKWTAGSESFARTKDLDAPLEKASPYEPVQVAAVYRADNSISVYRNGRQYGAAYVPASTLQTFKAGEARVLLGKRHTGGNKPFFAGEIAEAALYDRALSSEEIAKLFEDSPWRISDADLVAALSEEQRTERSGWLKELETARAELKSIPLLPVSYCGVRKEPAPTHLLKRGDVRSPEQIVAPGAISAIAALGSDLGLSTEAPEAERRRRFADWLADPRNPLPARVMVNRIWHYHFGVGLVSTPNDFGAAGAGPSHPELLDWLASELIARGWSIKAIQRLIVTSATYREASQFNAAAAAQDADNQLVWRFTPRRLEAEALRDAMLAVSGELNFVAGGPSFRPFDTKSFNATFYFPSDKTGPEFNRRTVYRMNVNSGKDPMLEAFDCPDPSVKTPRRGVTSTPLQALSLMNNSFVQRQAERLAARLLAEAQGDNRAAIRQAYRYCFARTPSPEELKRAEALSRSSGFQTFCWALLNSTEFVYVQ